MIYSKTVSLLIFFIVFLSCSKDEKNISVNAPVIELETYFGTYLFKDRECSGYDIQYLTIDENGISFFDYLGDLCDNTNNCYSVESFELIETAVDTILSINNDDNEIMNLQEHIDGIFNNLIQVLSVNLSGLRLLL